MENDLRQPSELEAFDRRIANYIRAEQFADAERLLRDAAAQYSSPATDLALKISDIRIDGWSAFNERIEALSKSGKPITAAWLHISNYTDDADDGLRHPVIELGYLHDGRVAFSQESTQSLLEMSANYPAPWTGAPDEDGQELEVLGLGQLNDTLVKRDWRASNIDTPTIRIADAIAQWFLKLYFHWAVHRTLSEHGLTRDIPLIVGSHGVGPWCNAIYRRSKLFAINPKRQPTKRENAKLQVEIEYQIGEWKKAWSYCDLMARRESPSHKELVLSFRHRANKWFAGTPFEGTYPCELKEADFEYFLLRWRGYRDPDFVVPEPPVAAPLPATSIGNKISRFFGRRGL